MFIRLASKLQRGSIVDGEGLRAVIWTQGCPHNCPMCHNPETHDYNGGYLEDIEELKKEINSLDCEEGVTFSGGDPFEQPEACLEIAKYCHKINLNVWCYTGYTYEQLIKKSKNMPVIIDFLKEIDVLVDGRFIYKLKSLEAKFRGSKNQRLIDVPKTLNGNNIVLYNCKSYYKVNYVKDDSIYI